MVIACGALRFEVCAAVLLRLRLFCLLVCYCAGLRFCLFVLIVVCVLLWVLKIGLVWIVPIGLFVVLFCLLLLLRSVVDCFLVCCYFAW